LIYLLLDLFIYLLFTKFKCQ